MSDVLNTNELIVAKLRKVAKLAEWYQALDPKLLTAAADALEAATRQPSEDDREVLRSILLDHLRGIDVSCMEAAILAAGFSRAAVPDTATEGDYHEGLEEGTKIGRAERDAALAAVDRVRAAVSGHPECDRYEEGDVISCGWKSAYASVVTALDVAPEPEDVWEYGLGNRKSPRDAGIPYPDEAHVRWLASALEETPTFGPQLMRRRKAGPWLPVEGESK